MKNSGSLKNKAILFGFIAGLLLIISVLWIVTQNVQSFFLMRSVNNIFISNNDSMRLAALAPYKARDVNILGYWYSINSSDNYMFVFSVFQDGIMVPLGAVVSPDREVKEIIPLSAHAVYVFDSLPQSILQMYIARIEGNRE